MRLKLLLIAFLSIASVKVFSQSNIGYYHDASGMPISSGLDKKHTTTNKVQVPAVSFNVFTSGSYIDTENRRHNGEIKYKHKKVYFKKSSISKKVLLKPSDIKAINLGYDSLFVVKTFFDSINGKSEAMTLAKFLYQVNDIAFAKRYQTHRTANHTIYFKLKGHKLWKEVPQNKDSLISFTKAHLGHLEIIKRKLESNEIKVSEIAVMIDYLRFDHKMRKDEFIYYDKFWNESTKKRARYFVKVKQTDPDYWVLMIHNRNHRLLFQKKILAWGSHSRIRALTSYYSNGRKRVSTTYQNGLPNSYDLLDSSGHILTSYSLNHIDKVTELSLVNDKNLESDTYSFFDPVRKITFHQSIVNNKIKETYYEKDGKRIFLITGGKKEFNIGKLQKAMDKEASTLLEEHPYKPLMLSSVKKSTTLSNTKLDLMEAFKTCPTQTGLVWLLVSPKGKVIDRRTLNSHILHRGLRNIIDNALVNFIPDMPGSKKMNRYKVGGKKVHYEVVVPFTMSPSRFKNGKIIYWNNNWPYDDLFWMNRTHDMLQNIRIPTAF